MWCDETNKDQTDRQQFFIYGGLIVPGNRLAALHDRIAAIRTEAGYLPTDSLKFGTKARPKQVPIADWTDAKAQVIRACRDVGASFMAVLIHHHIAAGSADKIVDWQFNTLLTRFDRNYLDSKHDDVGMVMMDRIGNQYEYTMMREKFTEGGKGGFARFFPRVISYSATCDGASHMASAADIVLGSFGYCVNQRGDVPATKALMPHIWPLIWHPDGCDVWGDGIMFAPFSVRSRSVLDDQAELRQHLMQLAAQPDPFAS